MTNFIDLQHICRRINSYAQNYIIFIDFVREFFDVRLEVSDLIY